MCLQILPKTGEALLTLGSEQSSTGNVDKAKQGEAIPFMKLGHGGHFTFK